MKTIGIQFTKNFVPEIINSAKSFVETVKQRKSKINYGKLIKITLFDLMANIMFGKNFNKDIETIVHHTPEGKSSIKSVSEVFGHFLSDTVSPSTKILYLFFYILHNLPWSP